MKRVLTFSGIVFVIALIDCHQEPVEGSYLAVSSTPQGADVYIDDSLTEYQTNCVIPDIEPGEYKISLKLYDFPEWSTVVKVEEGETTKVAGIFPINEGTIKWVYPIGDYYRGYQPAIGPDGTVYLYKGDLFALNPDGSVKWTYSAQGGSYWATIGSDGSIYFGQIENEIAEICALTSSGSLRWEYQADSADKISSVSIGADATIYFSTIHYSWTPNYFPISWLYALTSDGSLKWKREITYASTPTIGADGTIYVGCHDYLYAFDPSGSLKWAFQRGTTPPAIGSDGTLYFGSGDDLCALNPNGTLKWRYQTIGPTYQPAIGPDGTIYVGSTTYDPEYNPYASSLFAITPSGHLKWSLSLSSDDYISHIESTPAVGVDGMVYITHYPLGLCAFDENGNLKWNLDEVWSYSSPAIADDGTLYIAGYDGLYAIQTTSFGLASSPWPKFAHDNQNTGRWGGP
ncbi:MAG: PQQ-binding-like beta-propeller repeat protein [candidate division WOR-3 bacterium]|nr:PQQ-binding-like beta-propeller repeat protein [candidate division WOR-3 bacterium]